jgi:hypothetical protein
VGSIDGDGIGARAVKAFNVALPPGMAAASCQDQVPEAEAGASNV